LASSAPHLWTPATRLKAEMFSLCPFFSAALYFCAEIRFCGDLQIRSS